MSSPTWRTAPARIYNLGSSAAGDLRFGHEERLWAQMGEKMMDTACKIPVFLVNEEQMDILYPPRMKECLDQEKAREILSRYEKDDNLTIHLLEREAKGDFEKYTTVVAVGLYISCYSSPQAHSKMIEAVLSGAKRDSMDPEAEKKFCETSLPHIYLCPERILKAAQAQNIPPQLYLETVYYHELAHALMDPEPSLNCSPNDPYTTLWGRTIEESSANWITYTRFGESEVYRVRKIIASQPLEYQGYLALGKVPLYDLPANIKTSESEFRRELRQQFCRVMQAESARAMLIAKKDTYEEDPFFWEALQKFIYTLLNPLVLSKYFGTTLNPRYSEIILTKLLIPYHKGAKLMGELGAQVPDRTAWGRIFQWIEYKRKGAPRDPGYVIYWEELALFMLASSVKTSL